MSTSEPTTDATASVGLEAGTRYRCTGCGNLTRFDVHVREESVRFWHVDLSGAGAVDATEVRERQVASVTCRWCGSSDHIVVEPTPLQAGDERD